ncbi:C-GCAxxG-C-C family protein [Campylobacter sp. RM15925]|uniref:C-GCAxxG-C-C family protein n=1 Tax=Campylobacter sp. RM15925 TaxID=1705724 RepID=UPI0014734457|nr:C-GCAxxG-C-C family protein [Campylobacter sp. RM15925]
MKNRAKLEVTEIANKFSQINCAQILFERYAQDINMDPKAAVNLGSGLGGGLREALTCDTYLASVLILGAKFGGDKEKFEAKLSEFKEKFQHKWNSKICKEILGYDLSKPEEMKIIQEKGLFGTICPCVVKDCIEILDEIIE